MNAMKVDEGVIVMADINIDQTIQMIRKQIDVPLTEEEIDYYVANHKPRDIQIRLVFTYYTRYFGSYRDLNLLTRRQYITLLLLLKKKLLIDLGYEEDGSVHYAALPYLLTGNVEDRVNTRIIRNNKFTAKLEESYIFQDIIKNKYSMLTSFKPDELMTMISSIINTRFTYVTYEYPDLLGTEITYSEDKISDELLFFLNSL